MVGMNECLVVGENVGLVEVVSCFSGWESVVLASVLSFLVGGVVCCLTGEVDDGIVGLKGC